MTKLSRPIKLSREEAVIVGRRFAAEESMPQSRCVAAAEEWYDAKRAHERSEQGLREYLKARFH